MERLALGELLQDLVSSWQFLWRKSVEGEGGAETFWRDDFDNTVLMGMLHMVEVLNIFHWLLKLLLSGPINFNFLYFFLRG